MLAVDRRKEDYLYQQVIDLVTLEIDSGALRVGDRLPSLRRMARALDVSIPTVKQAYEELERQGRLLSRPQSGFYVQAQQRNAAVRNVDRPPPRPVAVARQTLIEQVYAGIHQPGVVPLGIANPSMARPPARNLHRIMKRFMTRAEERSLSYAPMLGDPGLRRQIAFRYLDMGGAVTPQDVMITNGGQEALSLALQSVASAGDVIAVESPTYSGILELIETLGMLALEIESCPQRGLSLPALKRALGRESVRACVFSSSLNNPLGCATDDAHREALVDLLESYRVPLIEDDVFGELLFDGARPRPAGFFSRQGLVLTVGSFSKTAAPGYRIGWLLPGRFQARAAALKRSMSCSSGLLQQLTLSGFLASGDYDRHLRQLRPVLKTHCERMIAAVARSFPSQTCISQPRGGSVLWLQLPKSVDSAELFTRALARGVSISPGQIYSPSSRFRNFLRLSFGHPWEPRIDEAINTLGQLVRDEAGA